MVGINAMKKKANMVDMRMLAIIPVLADPSYSLAVKRVVQNGMMAAIKVK